MHRRTILLAGAALAAGCATTADPGKAAAKRKEIDAKVDKALSDLYTASPPTRDLADAAHGVLVFPDVITAGFVIGGSHGDGAMRKGTSTLGYYSLNSASVGLLAGAQSRTLYIFFMAAQAMNKFNMSEGWTVGGDASVVMADAGAMARLDKANAPAVLAFVRDQKGLMASYSLDGTKISRLKL